MAENKFPTEMVSLPSQGWFYDSKNPLSSGEIEIKYMTAKEEDILTSANLIKKGIVFDKLLQALIVDKKINYDDLLIGDKNAIMIAARILGYGKDYEVEIDDPSKPGTKQTDVIDLTQFDAAEYDGSTQTELNKNEFSFELPQSKRNITFQALTESKERKIKHQLEAQKKQARRMKDTTDRQLTTRLKNTIISIDDDTSQESINHFVDNELFAADSRALRTQINKVVPDVDLTYEFISEETGERREMLLPMDLGFFWPQS